MIIEQPAKYLRWIYPRAYWRMPDKEKVVYLTFDDGPIPEATPFILDVLDRYHIKATFFMVGDNARRYPHLLHEVRARGHRLGNHTMHHLSGFKVGTRHYLNDVALANKLLRTKLMRPPHGWMRWDEYALLSRHYKVVMWDVITRDYSRRLSAADVVDNVKRYSRPGSIITFHDSLRSIDKLRTALPESIEWLQSQGYRFALIP